MNKELIEILDCMQAMGRPLHTMLCSPYHTIPCGSNACRACPLATWAYAVSHLRDQKIHYLVHLLSPQLKGILYETH